MPWLAFTSRQDHIARHCSLRWRRPRHTNTPICIGNSLCRAWPTWCWCSIFRKGSRWGHCNDWSRGSTGRTMCCLLYTSDAADEEDSVDLGGRRIIKKKNKNKKNTTRNNHINT
eukprot:TRINITY_DN4885_c0_g1_i3.p1 TRINITY_DN4885_c0_g1~~TRINITY_DN4885_c0_g1_i3.p1  ORF type:complete len:114 (-),score=13.24 TRINITY_DN4885_c0_g1_i3:76-417(-)